MAPNRSARSRPTQPPKNKVSGTRWTPDENSILQACYGRNGISLEALQAVLPGRSQAAIRAQARKLDLSTQPVGVITGTKPSSRKRWSADEDERLLRVGAQMGRADSDIQAKFPGRSYQALRRRLFGLKPQDPVPTADDPSPSRATGRGAGPGRLWPPTTSSRSWA